MDTRYEKSVNKKDYSAKFLSFVMISSLIYGFNSQFYASCLIALCEIVTILLINQRANLKLLVVPKNHYALSLLFFLVGMLFSLYILYSNESLNLVFYNGMIRSIFIVIHFVFGFSLFQGYFKENRIDNVLFLLPLSVAIYAVYIFLDYNFNANTVLNNNNNALPLITNRRFLGYIALLGSLVGTYRLLNYGKLMEFSWVTILAIANLSVVIWLGGRGAIISYFIILLLFIAFDYYFRKNKLDIYAVKNWIILILLSLTITSPLNVFAWNGGIRLGFGSELYESIDEFGGSRVQMWYEAFIMFTEQPWFGYGPGTYRFLSDFGLNNGFNHPHNFILQILFEFGAVGLVCLGCYLTALGGKSLKLMSKVKDESLDLSIIMIGGLIIHGLVSGPLFHAQPVMIIVFLISYVFYRVRSGMTNEENSQQY
ncbi:hypothetical protein BCT07_06295 [Vibrio breoganii]|uniref:O-antigen ligase family protein n=1 Tax=Vibrio breoganii TaxID=553239 RepID=UPI000C862B4C|nr:O-antigen ligase family protein [Vibrio breoganii]PMO51297.1 hypothetical protein BCT07_06295 [Vibrio breoganii]